VGRGPWAVGRGPWAVDVWAWPGSGRRQLWGRGRMGPWRVARALCGGWARPAVGRGAGVVRRVGVRGVRVSCGEWTRQVSAP
jgi:hypothetical protein